MNIDYVRLFAWAIDDLLIAGFEIHPAWRSALVVVVEIIITWNIYLI